MDNTVTIYISVLATLNTAIFIPVLKWAFSIQKKIIELEAHSLVREDLNPIHSSIRKIDDKIDKRFVSIESCNFRHAQIKVR